MPIANKEIDAWLQLPPEVTMNRFHHEIMDSNAAILKQWGTLPANPTHPSSEPTPKYKQKVIFGAAKQCSLPAWDPGCAAIPFGPLSRDLYVALTSKNFNERYGNPQYQNPQFLSSYTVIGRVSDLIPIYKRTLDLLRATDQEKFVGQQAITQIFGEQEAHRRWVDGRPFGSITWWDFMQGYKPSNSRSPSPTPPPSSAVSDYEFGIGVDYSSSIFQTVDTSQKDLRFIAFNRSIFIASPSKLEAEIFKRPISLPLDLVSNLTRRPFVLDSQLCTTGTAGRQAEWQNTPYSNVKLPKCTVTGIGGLAELQNTTWSEVELATNVVNPVGVFPGSVIPSVLDFHETSKFRVDGDTYSKYSWGWEIKDTNLTSLREKWWPNMWYTNHSRALVGRYLNSSKEPEDMWNMRGGYGGVWTGQGEWLGWKEICGGVEGLYGDEGGDLDERADEGVVRNSFGNVVEGDDGGREFEGLRFGGGGV